MFNSFSPNSLGMKRKPKCILHAWLLISVNSVSFDKNDGVGPIINSVENSINCAAFAAEVCLNA